MAHARRLVAILVGCATWCLASTSVAYASMLHDPVPMDLPVVSSPGSSGAPLWQLPVFLALVVLTAVAIVGLGYSLSRSRRSQPAPRSQQPLPH